MTPSTVARTHKVLSIVTRWIWDALGALGLFTLHEFASKRWPDGTFVAQIALAVVAGTVFLWFALVAPFFEGLREGKKTDSI